MMVRPFSGIVILTILAGLNSIAFTPIDNTLTRSVLIAPLHSVDDDIGPSIQNFSITPENLTTATNLILVRAVIEDTDGISWVRVFACLANQSGFQLLCLPPHMMTLQGGAWEAEVEIPFATIPGDHIGFNITAQDNLGNANTYYAIKTVEEASSTENMADNGGLSTKDVGFGIWGPFLELAALALGIVLIRKKKKTD